MTAGTDDNEPEPDATEQAHRRSLPDVPRELSDGCRAADGGSRARSRRSHLKPDRLVRAWNRLLGLGLQLCLRVGAAVLNRLERKRSNVVVLPTDSPSTLSA